MLLVECRIGWGRKDGLRDGRGASVSVTQSQIGSSCRDDDELVDDS